VRFKIVRIYARSGPHVDEHKRLDDDATENVKPHLQLYVFCGVVEFAASREYVTGQGWRGKNAILSAVFRLEYLIPQFSNW